ncbi:RIP metalloprotease RseP [Candidatus Falkowbacteria bacterium]|nr:RIP metalloprotease RseP [Bacteroidales bacterium]MDD4176860.1 RIP metalloprotease RseP [Bacteroidales bacterium]MDD4741208.1 RIP metalloprotease RseP [Bacteroidales bacterium]NCU35979.1 RIP metalloprotease RseP [Candidatus Falkowbacteria bacterium]
MEILIQVLHLLLSLSVLVVVHEFGHFIAAKIFNTRVEKFYLFFNPWFSIFKFKIKDTEYGLGWVPLGGYVKISGMIDESMDKEQLKKPPQPWEFRSKPTWQRLIIMLGGVFMNALLAFVIYSVILFNYGEKYLPTSNLTDGFWVVDSVLMDAGLKTGDKVVSINGQVPPARYNAILLEMLYSDSMVVERNGQRVHLTIPTDLAGQLSEKRGATLLLRYPFVVANIPENSHNAAAGLQRKDRIVAIDGQPVKYYDQFPELAKQYAGDTVNAEVVRDGSHLQLPLAIDENGKIGVEWGLLPADQLEEMGIYSFAQEDFSLLESIPAGLKMANERLVDYVRQFKLLLNPETGAYKGLGGFVTIGSFFPTSWNWRVFWELTAFLSIMLAVLNILPIPALDGGHVMFLMYEIIARRKPSDKFLEYAQVVGMVLLFGLLIFANGNDIMRLFQ